MKKSLVIIFLFLVPLAFFVNYQKIALRQKILKQITVTEFMQELNPSEWEEKLHVNRKGQVVYKGMTIVKDYNKKPLNLDNADYTEELKILKKSGYYKLLGK